MRQRATLVIQAEKLPKEFAEALSVRPVHGSRLRITVEELEEPDEEKLANLRAAIQKGRDEIAAGKFLDGETAFEKLRAEYFPDKK